MVWSVTDGQSRHFLKVFDPSDDEAQSAAVFWA